MYFTFGGYKKFLDPLFLIFSSSVQAFLDYKHLHISAQQIFGTILQFGLLPLPVTQWREASGG